MNISIWQLKAIQVGTIYTTDTLRYHECLKPYEIKNWCSRQLL